MAGMVTDLLPMLPPATNAPLWATSRATVMAFVEAVEELIVKVASPPSMTPLPAAMLISVAPSSSVIAKLPLPVTLAPPSRPVVELAVSGASFASTVSDAPSLRLSLVAERMRVAEVAEGPEKVIEGALSSAL